MSRTLSRRSFLQTSLALGLGLLAAGCGGGASVEVGSTPSGLPWDELARQLTGPVLQPGNPGYQALATPWNLNYLGIPGPGAIARCANAQDVRTAILWAREHNVPLAARSGGHSYGAYSNTIGLQINTRLMNGVSYDPVTGLAVVGGGATNGDVYAALTPPSVALVHGRCKGVGVAGLTLGGGIGFDMRLHGLTCDGLVETEIVTADGEILVCNQGQNADLFWACRGGGGGNFGINTSFTFQTYPVGALTVYQIIWTTSLPQVLAALLDTLAGAPDRLGCKVTVEIAPNREVTVALLGQLVGTEAELRQLLDSVYAVAAPAGEVITETDYWTGQAFLSTEGAPEFGHERSRYVFSPLSSEAIATIFANLDAWPGTSQPSDWKFFLMGGAVARVASDATAYVHRPAIMVSSIELSWGASDSPETVAANEQWLADFHDAMRPFESESCYQNFIDPAQADFLQAYYGANLPRLMEVKRRYDPHNVFHFDQSIPVAT